MIKIASDVLDITTSPSSDLYGACCSLCLIAVFAGIMTGLILTGLVGPSISKLSGPSSGLAGVVTSKKSGSAWPANSSATKSGSLLRVDREHLVHGRPCGDRGREGPAENQLFLAELFLFEVDARRALQLEHGPHHGKVDRSAPEAGRGKRAYLAPSEIGDGPESALVSAAIKPLTARALFPRHLGRGFGYSSCKGQAAACRDREVEGELMCLMIHRFG